MSYLLSFALLFQPKGILLSILKTYIDQSHWNSDTILSKYLILGTDDIQPNNHTEHYSLNIHTASKQ